MALLQISEPGQSPEPHRRKRALGIDLGTTNSLVAAVRNGSAEVLPSADGAAMLPSAVRYFADGIQVGAEARRTAVDDPQNTLLSIKRFMGRGLNDIKTANAQLPYRFAADSDTVPKSKPPVDA